MLKQSCPLIAFGETTLNVALNPRTKSNPRTVLELRLQPNNVLVFGGLQHAPAQLVLTITSSQQQPTLGYSYIKALVNSKSSRNCNKSLFARKACDDIVQHPYS